jgi:Integrase core domain
MHVNAVRTTPRSPWQNASVERLIGSIRRECLDHVIVVNEVGLRRVLASYVAFYMGRVRISRWRKIAQCLGPSNRPQTAASWPRQKSAAYTTATSASPHSIPPPTSFTLALIPHRVCPTAIGAQPASSPSGPL